MKSREGYPERDSAFAISHCALRVPHSLLPFRISHYAFRILFAAAVLLAMPAPVRAGDPPAVHFVVIDSRTQFTLGPLPWPRERYAKMVTLLDKAGATAIVLNFYFRDSKNDADDKALVQAAKKSGKVYVMIAGSTSPQGWQPSDAWLDRMAVKADGKWPKKTPEVSNIQAPFEKLAEVVKGVGSIGYLTDSRKIFQCIPLFLRYRGKPLPSLGLRLFLDLNSIYAMPLVLERREFLRVGPKRVNLDKYAAGSLDLTPPGIYPVHSFADVLKGKVPARKFKGAVVIVATDTPEMMAKTASGPKNSAEIIADQLHALCRDLL